MPRQNILESLGWPTRPCEICDLPPTAPCPVPNHSLFPATLDLSPCLWYTPLSPRLHFSTPSAPTQKLFFLRASIRKFPSGNPSHYPGVATSPCHVPSHLCLFLRESPRHTALACVVSLLPPCGFAPCGWVLLVVSAAVSLLPGRIGTHSRPSINVHQLVYLDSAVKSGCFVKQNVFQVELEIATH